MIHMKHIGILFFLCIFNGLYSYSVVPGNSALPSATFDFPIAQFIGQLDSVIFVSAAEDGAKNFSIAHFDPKLNSFQPFVPEDVTLNGIQTTNPLFNKKVQFIGLSGQKTTTFAVADDITPTIYFLDNTNAHTMLSYENILDAQGNISSGIIALTGSNTARAFVAVKPAEGEFGDPGSGIGVIGTILEKIKVADKEETHIALHSCGTIPFDKRAHSLAIQNPLATLQAPVSLWWDAKQEFLYAGVGNAIAGNQKGDGVISVALGINDLLGINTCLLRSIFHHKMKFTGVKNHSIIVAGPNEQLSVHHLATMITSTSRDCLIVGGGNGAPNMTSNTIYAIPLVPFGDFKGLVANKYNTRQPAFTIDQCVLDTDPQARVGGGPLRAGAISSLYIREDAVFVTVSEDKYAGVYSSRALFNAQGDIIGWTQWARAASITQSIFAASLDLSTGTIFMLTANSADSNIPNTIVRNAWCEGDESPYSLKSVISLINASFPQNTGGVQGIYNFQSTTPGLDAISILAVLGRNALALIQTGEEKDTLIPTQANAFIEAINTNGRINNIIPDQTILLLEGGILNTVGPLTNTTIAYSAMLEDTWIFVAGSHGVAVLQKSDGSGCGNAISAHFSGIEKDMQWIPFGNYRFVRKIIADGDYLYILTDTHLDRVHLAPNIQESTITRIAQIPMAGLISQPTVFTDCAISNSVGLLATSSTLLHTAIGSRITDKIPQWQKITVPESEIPIMALYPVSATGNQSDFARGVGGNIYILSGNNYRNISLINRFAIHGLAEEAVVTQDTIQPFFVDQFIKGKPSYFIDYGETKSIFATDGALTFAVHNKQGTSKTTIKIPFITSLPMNSARFVGVRSQPLTNVVPDDATVAALLQNSATGSWLVGGTMGMKVNE